MPAASEPWKGQLRLHEEGVQLAVQPARMRVRVRVRASVRVRVRVRARVRAPLREQPGAEARRGRGRVRGGGLAGGVDCEDEPAQQQLLVRCGRLGDQHLVRLRDRLRDRLRFGLASALGWHEPHLALCV